MELGKSFSDSVKKLRFSYVLETEGRPVCSLVSKRMSDEK